LIKIFQDITPGPTIAQNMLLASVLKQGSHFLHQCAGAVTTNHPDSLPIELNCFDQAKQLRAILDQWAIKEITMTDEDQAIAQAIKNGTAIAVKDGSYKDARGMVAFILETLDNFNKKGRIVGVNLTPGETKDQSSF
jgi:hypothetical protein